MSYLLMSSVRVYEPQAKPNAFVWPQTRKIYIINITVLANENGICVFQLLWFLNAQIIVAQRLLYSYNETQETRMNCSSKPPWPWLLNKSDLRLLWLYYSFWEGEFRLLFCKIDLVAQTSVCVDKKSIKIIKTVKIKDLNKTPNKRDSFVYLHVMWPITHIREL